MYVKFWGSSLLRYGDISEGKFNFLLTAIEFFRKLKKFLLSRATLKNYFSFSGRSKNSRGDVPPAGMSTTYLDKSF